MQTKPDPNKCSCPTWFDTTKHRPPFMQDLLLCVEGKVIVGWNGAEQPEEDPCYYSWAFWPGIHINSERVTHWMHMPQAPNIEMHE